MSKGISPLVAYILIVFISVAGIVVVLTIGLPAIQRAKEAGTFNEAVHNLQVIDNAIKEVASEGLDSSRTVQLGVTGGEYRVDNATGTLIFSFVSKSGIVPYGSYMKQGNIRIFGGGFDGLVGYWNLDEGSGYSAVDNSGHDNTGMIYGASWTDGKYGKALSFDGVDDYVEIANSSSLNSQNITYEAWINPLISTGTFNPVIFMRETDTGDNVFLMRGGIHSSGWKGVSCEWPPVWWEASYSFEEGEWYHVACVVSGTNRKIYVNGELIGENETSNSINYSSAGRLFIGQDQDGASPSDFFNGTIDEGRIYNRALTAQEIKSMYEGSKPTVNITMLLQYPKIRITGDTRIATGNYKLCVEKTGYSSGKATVSVNVC